MNIKGGAASGDDYLIYIVMFIAVIIVIGLLYFVDYSAVANLTSDNTDKVNATKSAVKKSTTIRHSYYGGYMSQASWILALFAIIIILYLVAEFFLAKKYSEYIIQGINYLYKKINKNKILFSKCNNRWHIFWSIALIIIFLIPKILSIMIMTMSPQNSFRQKLLKMSTILKGYNGITFVYKVFIPIYWLIKRYGYKDNWKSFANFFSNLTVFFDCVKPKT